METCTAFIKHILAKSEHRNEWPLARVVNVFPGQDGLVRKIEVRIFKDGKFLHRVRPVNEVVHLIED